MDDLKIFDETANQYIELDSKLYVSVQNKGWSYYILSVLELRSLAKKTQQLIKFYPAQTARYMLQKIRAETDLSQNRNDYAINTLIRCFSK